ncbi:MAG TPA: MFS transporter [Candidatus Limnocylindrales bacterium]|nr:MFS transporter [Candidatus Limnocylindrales bacterium]
MVSSILDLSTRFRALKHRNFRLFVIGQLISLIGTWMQNLAQQWLVYSLTKSAFLLGVFGFASQLPMLCLAWMGGYVGDRYNRHRGVITTQTISMILAFVLAFLTLTHLIKTWHLMVIAFLVGIVNAFDVPIRQAFFVHMVGKEDLPNAIALNSSIFNGARVIGPAIAGFTILLVGEGWCFFLNGLSFVAVIIALLMMRIERTENKKASESPIRSFIEGFRFAMQDHPIRSALILLSLLSLFGLQYSVFLPIYASDILHGGAGTLGWLMSAAGVGAVLGALQFAARTEYKGLSRWIASTCTTCGLALLVFAFSNSFWLCATLLFVVGFAATSQMAATNTIIQQRVPDEMRSRLMAVYATLFMGVMPIGALIAGSVAKHIGTPHTVLLFGVAVLVGSLVFFDRVVMKIKSEKPAPALT